MQQKIIRAIRIIEYEGEESWVNGCLNNPNNVVAPSRDFIAGNNGVIRELSGRGVKLVAKVVTKLEIPLSKSSSDIDPNHPESQDMSARGGA